MCRSGLYLYWVLLNCLTALLSFSLSRPWGEPRCSCCLGSLQNWDSFHRLPWRNSAVPVVFRPGAKGMATGGDILHPPTACACACVCASHTIRCTVLGSCVCTCLVLPSCRSSPLCVVRCGRGRLTWAIRTRSLAWCHPRPPLLGLWRRTPLASVASRPWIVFPCVLLCGEYPRQLSIIIIVSIILILNIRYKL